MVIKKWLIGLFFCFVRYEADAQVIIDDNLFVYHQMIAPSRLHPDFLAYLENCSLLSEITKPKISLFAENKFMIKELQSFNLNVAIPFNNISCDVTEKYFGNTILKSHQISLSVAKKIDPRLGLGVKWRYGKILTPNQVSSCYISGSIALIMNPSSNFSVGIGADNIINVFYKNQGSEKLKGVYKIGAGVDCTNEIYLGLKMVKASGERILSMGAIHYQLGAAAKIKYGINFNTMSNEVGVDLMTKKIVLMFDINYHPQLGPSTFLALQNKIE